MRGSSPGGAAPGGQGRDELDDGSVRGAIKAACAASGSEEDCMAKPLHQGLYPLDKPPEITLPDPPSYCDLCALKAEIGPAEHRNRGAASFIIRLPKAPDGGSWQ
jgi:hypothetical protein